jgi:hypothetical protein
MEMSPVTMDTSPVSTLSEAGTEVGAMVEVEVEVAAVVVTDTGEGKGVGVGTLLIATTDPS